MQEGMLVCREVINSLCETMATVIMLNDGRRLYNLMNTTTDEGRKNEANYLLFDAIIQEFAGQKLVLDFEGSDLPGVKRFYESIGPENQPYFKVKYNNLPWPIRIIKG